MIFENVNFLHWLYKFSTIYKNYPTFLSDERYSFKWQNMAGAGAGAGVRAGAEIMDKGGAGTGVGAKNQ